MNSFGDFTTLGQDQEDEATPHQQLLANRGLTGHAVQVTHTARYYLCTNSMCVTLPPVLRPPFVPRAFRQLKEAYMGRN